MQDHHGIPLNRYDLRFDSYHKLKYICQEKAIYTVPIASRTLL